MTKIREEPTEDIIKKIQDGDSYLYGEIFRRYQYSLYYMICKMVGNKEDAKDLMMITFEKAYNMLKEWRPNYLFVTWLYTIGKNTAVDFLRRKQLRPSNFIDTDEVGYQFHSHYRPPDQICEERDWMEKVSGKINLLPERCKKVLELKTKDISDEDIASRLNIKHGNVRCILSRARNQLKHLIL